MARPDPDPDYPAIRDIGLTGLLVSFAGALSEPANRAALAFRAAVEAAGWDGVAETSTSLVSAFIGYEPLSLDRDDLAARLEGLLRDRDWCAAPLPEGRRHWRIPVVLGGQETGPQFEEAAEAAGLSAAAARDSIAASRTRVLTIGFAPGQPYMGELDQAWDIPRMKTLNPRVPEGALVVAIRQLIVFSRTAPTGWRHIGQTAFRAFRPEADEPFAFRPGDEVSFRLVEAAELEDFRAADATGDGGDGGAEVEMLE